MAEEEQTENKTINKDMIFDEALKISGMDGAKIMSDYGLHCIGCHIAVTETIAQGCAAHGIDEKQRDEMIDKINSRLKSE